MRAPAPAYLARDAGEIAGALGDAALDVVEAVGEIGVYVARDRLIDVLTILRDRLEYQQLMEIVGVDYPDRPERFEVVYNLLSLTKNHRIRVHVSTDEEQPVPSVTGMWPVAGWLEREVYDMYGVLFAGNPDLRRILTDYGFRGHPFRKDFPLSGFVELRYSEEAKRVVYEPVKLAQDFRTFDFTSPWEGAAYVLPGDEKAGDVGLPQAKGAQTPLKAEAIVKADAAESAEKASGASSEPYAKMDAQGTSDTGAGKPAAGAGARPANPDVMPEKDGGQNQ